MSRNKRLLGGAAALLALLLVLFWPQLWKLVDFVLHIDRHLTELSAQYGPWLYAILFLIIFCETGLVITPILPGDSLLFITGTLAATGHLDIGFICLLLTGAAILGDLVNFYIGKYFGARLLERKLIKESHYQRAYGFYEKYGGRTIILARFVPIVRTLAPFVAGLSHMEYKRFFAYNIIGALIWIVGITVLGYSFGTLPLVQKHFGKVVLLIIGLSVLPALIEIIRVRRERPVETIATAENGQ